MNHHREPISGQGARLCLRAVTIASGLLVLAACANPPGAGLQVEASGECYVSPIIEEDGARILFIGNSYTALHGGLNTHVEKVFAAADPPIALETEACISWAKDLEYHYTQTDDLERIRGGGWDFVVLQSFWESLEDQQKFYHYVREFDRVIRESGAQTVLFYAWTGSPTASWMSIERYTHDTRVMAEAHYRIAREINAPVVPCGVVWEDLILNPPQEGLPIDYLYRDSIHQNGLGTAVNAYTFYAVLTGKSPVGIEYEHESFDSSPALHGELQERVRAVLCGQAGLLKEIVETSRKDRRMSELLTSHRYGDADEPLPAAVHAVTEICFELPIEAEDPFQAVDVDMRVETPDGRTLSVPAFWAGGNEWRVRIAPDREGTWSFELAPVPGIDTPQVKGRLQTGPQDDLNPLLRHGPIRLSRDSRHFEHADGTPFLWLADSWWFGMCKRIHWPDEFQLITRDRAEKGFSVIQFAIGFACDIVPYDERDANEAGFPWNPTFESINPAYFDLTDQRILTLIQEGLVPNIVGMWGYYLSHIGVDKARKHWRYLIARYGAFPVTWTLCGEVRLVWYLEKDGGKREELRALQQREWANIGRMIQQIDPWDRPLTTHIGPRPGGKNSPPLEDMNVLDFHFLQPGHSDSDAVPKAMSHLREERETYPGKPVLVGEICFEGMHGGAGPKVQRNIFWSCMLSGTPGHCYGTDSLWQMNRRDQPFGPSAGGYAWGNSPWEEAYQWKGSLHLGIGKQILERFEWWRFEPRQEWVAPHASPDDWFQPYAAGIPGEVRLFYFPRLVAPWGQRFTVTSLENGITYDAAFISPMDGTEHPIGECRADPDGTWPVPPAPVLHDWLLALRRK